MGHDHMTPGDTGRDHNMSPGAMGRDHHMGPPRGFDTYLIKGKPLVPGASEEDLARLATTAVPCADLEEAIALERAFGDGGPGQH